MRSDSRSRCCGERVGTPTVLPTVRDRAPCDGYVPNAPDLMRGRPRERSIRCGRRVLGSIHPADRVLNGQPSGMSRPGLRLQTQQGSAVAVALEALLNVGALVSAAPVDRYALEHAEREMARRAAR